MIKKTLKYIANKMGYVVLKNKLPDDIVEDKQFIIFFQQTSPYTMVSPDRAYVIHKAIQYISDYKIDGDVVECGVWKGGQSMLMARTLASKNDFTRKLWLYDTYAGMSEPTQHDIYMTTMESGSDLWEKGKKEDYNDWCYASLEEVRENMIKTDYPMDKIEFVKGKVEDTLPTTIPEKIAILRLDTDLYESTYHELVHLYPRLVSGGVFYIDDYGSWSGSKKAVDEYIEKYQAKIMLVRVGMSRIGIKME